MANGAAALGEPALKGLGEELGELEAALRPAAHRPLVRTHALQRRRAPQRRRKHHQHHHQHLALLCLASKGVSDPSRND